jgi:hypothetical protein
MEAARRAGRNEAAKANISTKTAANASTSGSNGLTPNRSGLHIPAKTLEERGPRHRVILQARSPLGLQQYSLILCIAVSWTMTRWECNVNRAHRLGFLRCLSQCLNPRTFFMCNWYCPARLFLVILWMRTVTSGTGRSIPLSRRSSKGTVTFSRRLVQ